MNDDGIDESHFLPAGEPIVNRHRLAKADMKVEYHENGDIKFAQQQLRNILNFLHQQSIITDEQHDDGHVFQAWRDQHRVALGLQKAVSGGVEASTSVKLRAYGFILILRKLNRHDYQAIESAVDTFCNGHTTWQALRDARAYRGAFSRLEIVLVPIKERVAALESMPDIEREAMQMDNLKTLLDIYRKAV